MPINIERLKMVSIILFLLAILLVIPYIYVQWDPSALIGLDLNTIRLLKVVLPALFFVGVSFLIISIGGLVYIYVYYTPPAPRPIPQPRSEPPEETVVKPSIAMPYGPKISYSLVFPDGTMLKVQGKQFREFGRSDFRGRIDPNIARLISKLHFGIKVVIDESGKVKYYIKDLGSRNGTLLNGTDIRDRGWIEIKDGDIISPAGAINLVFRVETI